MSFLCNSCQSTDPGNFYTSKPYKCKSCIKAEYKYTKKNKSDEFNQLELRILENDTTVSYYKRDKYRPTIIQKYKEMLDYINNNAPDDIKAHFSNMLD